MFCLAQPHLLKQNCKENNQAKIQPLKETLIPESEALRDLLTQRYTSLVTEKKKYRTSVWSTDTEAVTKRIEREGKSSPSLIGGRIMTTEGLDDEMKAGPSNPQPISSSTPS